MHIINEHLEARIIDPLLERTRGWQPTVRYLSQTEVHVYALSISASVVLSLYPFLTVMFSIIRFFFFHAKPPATISPPEAALWTAIYDYFPGDLGEFIHRNLSINLNKPAHGRFQIVSLILLLLTANGIFEPLEVALNRAWGATKNRSYLRNQFMSLGLIILCGGLVIGSTMLTAINESYVQTHIGIPGWLSHWVPLLVFKLVAIPLTVLALFLTYWLLPNCRVPVRPLARVSIVVGVALEVLKYVVLAIWPWLTTKLDNEYGVFQRSVEVILFAMVASFIVLAGAEWTARHAQMSAAKIAAEAPRPIQPV